jgi:hypothetical protein
MVKVLRAYLAKRALASTALSFTHTVRRDAYVREGAVGARDTRSRITFGYRTCRGDDDYFNHFQRLENGSDGHSDGARLERDTDWEEL